MLILPGHINYGYAAITSPDKPAVERNSYLCCHCQRMVIVKPGSGRVRSWCYNCGAGTCGARECVERCIPFEAKLEAMEGRRRFWKQLELTANGERVR